MEIGGESVKRLTEKHVKKSDGHYMKCSEHCQNETLQCFFCAKYTDSWNPDCIRCDRSTKEYRPDFKLREMKEE